MRNAPALHGRDHCPGGADPIPCLTRNEWAYAMGAVGSTVSIATGNNFVGNIGSYYTMAHSNSDVFELGPSSTDIIRTKKRGLYSVTAWLDLNGTGDAYSSIFDIAIGVQGYAAGLSEYWDRQPEHPDAMIRTANWTSGIYPLVLRTVSWHKIPGTTPLDIDWSVFLNNLSGLTNASHQDMTVALEIVWFGMQTETTPIYELGGP